MNNENELLEPLATEAGQLAIARAINNLSSLEYAVRAERAATNAAQSADEALNSANDASDSEEMARKWATKTDGAVAQEMIEIPPEQEGDDPTTETINLYSARYYAALAEETYNNMQFDSEPTENSTKLLSSGTIYTALYGKADKSTTYTKTETDNLINTRLSELIASAPATLDTLQELATALGNDPNFATTIATQLGNKADKSTTYTKTEVDTALSAKADLSTTYTKTEVDTALSNVQSTLTFDNVPTANSDNPVKSSGIKTALDGKQDALTFDSTPTANSTNPVTSGGVYTSLQNVNIDIDDEITEDSDNPVTSAAIYAALQNVSPAITIDSTVTESSTNPVTSAGIYNAIENAVGAGSLASGVVRDELWSGTLNTANDTKTLSHSILDYDFIEVIINKTNWLGSPLFSIIKPAKEIIDKDILIDGWNDTSGFLVSFPSNTNIKLGWRSNTEYYISGVYGIKFSKNLSEQMYSNVLYENSSGVTSGTITLNDDLSNYDFAIFHLLPTGWLGGTFSYIMDTKNITGISIGVNTETYMFFTTNGTTATITEQKNIKLVKVIGYKLAKGGYSGIVSDARMTVKSGTITTDSGGSSNTTITKSVVFDSPMPDTNYLVVLSFADGTFEYANARPYVYDLSKTINGFDIKAWCNGNVRDPIKLDWVAIRPNSYTREGMVEDVLFNTDTPVYTLGEVINLSGNISDYDLIEITTRFTANSGSEPWKYHVKNIFSSQELLDTQGQDKKNLNNTYSNSYITSYCANGDNQIICRGNTGQMGITKIVGIKFGRYVSGVAVDTTVTQNSNAVVTSGAVYDALQNISSGGGSSITVDSTITQGSTNPVQGGAIYTALDNKADAATTLNGYGITDAYTKTEVDTALASKGDVTTDTNQNITGTKTFVGSKKIAFKLSAANDKLGFTLYSNSNAERGYLEFNPTNTVDGVAGLMTLGNYATSAASLTQVGFRRYSNISGESGAYNLLMPMVADARTPFSLTTTYQNFYLPLGFTDGTTTVKTAKSGVVDLSPLLASLEARIEALEGN